jgi:RNA polymerase sigma-70 factor (ECF subfamily)
MNATLTKKRAKVTPETSLSDEELLVRYSQTGQRELFSELVQRYERELFSYLRRYLGDSQLAEDAFQATFLQVHLKCGQFAAERRVRPWLYAIATNQAIDARRRDKRHRLVSLDRSSQDGEEGGKLIDLLVSDEPLPVTQLSEEERQVWLAAAIKELPESLQSTLTLIYYQDMKYREAAEVLNLPVGTVKSRMHAAVQKLHEAWLRKFAETP